MTELLPYAYASVATLLIFYLVHALLKHHPGTSFCYVLVVNIYKRKSIISLLSVFCVRYFIYISVVDSLSHEL